MNFEALKAFVRKVALADNMSQEHIAQSKRGGMNPGSFAHWRIALAHAKYLEPQK